MYTASKYLWLWPDVIRGRRTRHYRRTQAIFLTSVCNAKACLKYSFFSILQSLNRSSTRSRDKFKGPFSFALLILENISRSAGPSKHEIATLHLSLAPLGFALFCRRVLSNFSYSWMPTNLFLPRASQVCTRPSSIHHLPRNAILHTGCLLLVSRDILM